VVKKRNNWRRLYEETVTSLAQAAQKVASLEAENKRLKELADAHYADYELQFELRELAEESLKEKDAKNKNLDHIITLHLEAAEEKDAEIESLEHKYDCALSFIRATGHKVISMDEKETPAPKHNCLNCGNTRTCGLYRAWGGKDSWDLKECPNYNWKPKKAPVGDCQHPNYVSEPCDKTCCPFNSVEDTSPIPSSPDPTKEVNK
jgi:hypothetical protein